MKRINKKGFSLVEILAAIAILGILMAIATTAYNRYKRSARQQAYDTMAKSSISAAKNYMMDNVQQKYITLDTLLEQEYIDTLQDPRYKEEQCSGIVINKVIQGQTQKQLDAVFQKVKLCCKNYKYQYDYTGDDVVVTKIDSCEYVPGDEIDGVYKLVYKTQGGTACDPSVVVKKEKEEWGTLCVTTKEGSVFKEWNTNKYGTGTTITANTIVGNKDITAYAIWDDYYNLTFNEEGGSVCNPKTIIKKRGAKWGTLCEPTKVGYVFKGWTTEKNGAGKKITNNTVADNNLKVYAHWNPYYTLTYDSNGGSTCENPTKTQEKGVEWGTLCQPTRAGYTFVGWKNGTTTITKTTKATENIIVKAEWKKNTYTLTYNSNGGSTCNPASITKAENVAWGTLCTPTRTGYKFAGWKSGTTTVTETSIAKANITVTAQWKQNTYTLTYNSNGGSKCNPASITKAENVAWGTLCTPTRAGYKFAGWKSGTTTVTATSKATANITVTAQWKQNTYTLTYNSNGGSTCNPASITKAENVAWGTLCTPTRTGYKFAGWKNGTTTVTATSKATANITVTAQWNANSYTLKYNDNGGSGCSSKTIKRTYNTVWGTLCTPTRKGYTFAGWKNGTTTVTSASKATANITVTAQWNANSYTLRYNDNGGSGCSSKTITKTYNTAWGTLCTPTRSGYKFTGWKSNNTTITASTKATGNITVTAQWTALTQKTYSGTVKLKDYYGNTVSGYNQSISCKTYDSSCQASTSTKYIGTRSGTLVVINSQTFTLNTTGASFTHDWDFYDGYYVTDSGNGLNARRTPSTSGALVDGLNIGHHFYPSRIAYDSGSGCSNHIWAYGYSYEEGWSGWVCSYYLY